eukprot:TRINITY_DN19211_c0_g1_i1.p1 TRINITY_DN19211_c0_g1~~TRINITY_DN19211_c0_g1_i1.p1  ORF type:complete len:1928 (+),score=575.61 TRINITY_DN19211_c0_g1_i1:628-5784(+)
MEREIRVLQTNLRELESAEALSEATQSGAALRAEVEEARKASAYVWGLAEDIGGEASENEALQQKYACVEKDQWNSLEACWQESEELQQELHEASRLASSSDVILNTKLSGLKDQAARLHIARTSLCSELEFQRHSDSVRIESSVAAEHKLQGELQAERKQLLHELSGFRRRASTAHQLHCEIEQELEAELGALAEHRHAFELNESQLKAESQLQQDDANARDRELSVGFLQLQEAHRDAQFRLRAECDSHRAEAERLALAESRLQTELDGLTASIGGRSAAQLQRFLAESEEQLSQIFAVESGEGQRANALLLELQEARCHSSEHDAALEAHLAARGNNHVRAASELRSRMSYYVNMIHEAALAEDADMRAALVQQQRLSMELEGELDAARRAISSAQHSEVQQLQAEIDALGVEERQELMTCRTQEEALRAEVYQAESAWRTMQRAAPTSATRDLVGFALDAPSKQPLRIDEYRAAQGAAQEVESLVLDASQRTARDVAAPLGDLLRRKAALSAEAARLEEQRLRELANKLRFAEEEQREGEANVSATMRAAAGRVELLRRTLRSEVATLRGEEGDGAGTGARHAWEQAVIADEASHFRSLAVSAASRVEAMRAAEARSSVESQALRDSERVAEERLHQEAARLQSVGRVHAEECERSRQLGGLVSAHTEVLQPARESELRALKSEGQFLEAQLRTEIAGERQAAHMLAVQSAEQADAAAEAEVECQRLQDSADAAAALVARVNADHAQLEARHAAGLAELRSLLQRELQEADEDENYLRQDVDRQSQELKHLEQLGFNIERAVEERILSRTSVWRDELNAQGERALQQQRERGLALEQLRYRGLQTQAHLSRLQEVSATLAGELQDASEDHSRWCGNEAMPPAHAVAATQLTASLERLRASAAAEIAEARKELDDLCANAARDARMSESAIALQAEREALATGRAALVASEALRSRAASCRQDIDERLPALRSEAAELGGDLSGEQALCVSLEYQIRALHRNLEGTEQRVEERLRQQRRQAAEELQAMRGTMSALRDEVASSQEVTECAICGEHHNPGEGHGDMNMPVVGRRRSKERPADSLLARWDAVARSEARWRQAAADAEEFARESAPPPEVELDHKQLRSIRREMQESQQEHFELKRALMAAPEALAAANATHAARGRSIEARLQRVRAAEEAAEEAVVAQNEDAEAAADWDAQEELAARSRVLRLERDLAEGREEIAALHAEAEEQPKAMEWHAARVKARCREAEGRARNIERLVLERLRVIQREILAKGAPAPTSPPLALRTVESDTSIASVGESAAPVQSRAAIGELRSQIAATWKGLLASLRQEAEVRLTALAAREHGALHSCPDFAGGDGARGAGGRSRRAVSLTAAVAKVKSGGRSASPSARVRAAAASARASTLQQRRDLHLDRLNLGYLNDGPSDEEDDYFEAEIDLNEPGSLRTTTLSNLKAERTKTREVHERQQDALRAEHAERLAEQKRRQKLAEEELRKEAKAVSDERASEEDAFARRSRALLTEMATAGKNGRRHLDRCMDEWLEEKDSQHASLCSWRASALEARLYLEDASGREVQLRQEAKEAQAKVDAFHERMRARSRRAAMEKDCQMESEIDTLQWRLAASKRDLAAGEEAFEAYAMSEAEAQEARQAHHGDLLAELHTMHDAMLSLQRKHSSAMSVLQELQKGFERQGAASAALHDDYAAGGDGGGSSGSES